MARRPIMQKKLNKLRRTLRKNGGALPTYIDLIEYLKVRRIAQTTGHAKAIILAGRVKSESHVLGIKRVSMLKDGKVQDVDIVDPLVPARLRGTLTVLPEQM